MSLKLIFPSKEYKEEWYSIVKEIEDKDEKMTPYALKGETENYDIYLKNAENNSKGLNIKKDRVPSDIYFLVEEGKSRILGAIDIRHSLNDYLYNFGGNIGYGIRPSERRKGYATKMLGLALDKSRELGLEKVLITCNKENIGSAKTIIKNGGKLENEIIEGNILTQRYWIELY